VRGQNRTLVRGTFQFAPDSVQFGKCVRPSLWYRPMPLLHKKVTHDQFCEAIVRAFTEVISDSHVCYLDGTAMEAQGRVAQRSKELKSHEWLFGKASLAKGMITRNFAFGRFEVAFRFEGPKVKQVLVHSDCQVPSVVEKFEDCINLVGRSRLPQTLSQRLYRPAMGTAQEREMTQELVRWIMPEIKKVEFLR
jgi:hypothetical protein